jgi:hypothetical protein
VYLTKLLGAFIIKKNKVLGSEGKKGNLKHSAPVNFMRLILLRLEYPVSIAFLVVMFNFLYQFFMGFNMKSCGLILCQNFPENTWVHQPNGCVNGVEIT